MGSNKNKGYRKRKRDFRGNRYHKKQEADSSTPPNNNNVNVLENNSVPQTVSSSKVFVQETDDSIDSDNYNILINFSILNKLIENVSSCPECDSGLIFTDEKNKRQGFSHKLYFKCSSTRCTFAYSTFTSKEVVVDKKKNKQGRNFFDVNLKMVIAFREIGKGHRAMTDFSRMANMSCMSINGFQNANTIIQEAYAFSAEQSTKEAAMKVKEEAKEEDNASGKKLITVSTDGAWQKRGHVSLNGVVATISEGKCLDFEVFSKYCRGCQMWHKNESKPGYQAWKANHICSLNHTTSSGAMEGSGAVKIFNRSVEKNDLIYKYYLGDGDSSSYGNVVASKPYEAYGIEPEKLECVGHIQKRIGTRLRNRRKEKHNGMKLTGHGKLTEVAVNAMQNYFGMAIRQTSALKSLNDKEKVYQMKKNIRAVLYHCTDFPATTRRHILCPTGPNSWCKWKKSEGASVDNSYRPKVNLPIWIYDIVRKDFEELSDDKILKRCTHGKTQNANESLNNVIWSRCPKNIFLHKSSFEMGVNSAVLHFNEGTAGVKRVLNFLNLEIGAKTILSSSRKDKARLSNMARKDTLKVKNRRRKLRAIRKGWVDKEKELEGGESYKSGNF